MTPSPRPLSPHLQVYRWQIQMVASILHRASGMILAVGSLLIVAALVALAAGPEAWARASAYSASWFGLLVWFGWTWAFAYHLLNGIRHLLLDAGWGFSIPAFVRSGWLALIGSFVLTALSWAVLAARGVFT